MHRINIFLAVLCTYIIREILTSLFFVELFSRDLSSRQHFEKPFPFPGALDPGALDTLTIVKKNVNFK